MVFNHFPQEDVITVSLARVATPLSPPLPQGSLGWNGTFHLAGDNHDLAPPRARANLRTLEEKGVAPLVDVFQWDAGRLPLKTSSVDVVVTDLVSCQGVQLETLR